MTDGGHIVICRGVYDAQYNINYSAFDYKIGGKDRAVLSRSGSRYLAYYHWQNKLAHRGERGAEQVCYHYGKMPFIIW